MEQKTKDILLKDLCARLPYGVKIQTDYIDAKTLEGFQFPNYFGISDGYYSFDDMECKPYLFPLESMTEEATREFNETLEWIMSPDGYYVSILTYDSFDCLNKYHIDYRGLIEKDLAIDATGKNIY